MPRRAAIALPLTAAALFLLLNFRTPEVTVSSVFPSPLGATATAAGPTVVTNTPGPTAPPAIVGGSASLRTPSPTPAPASASGQATGQVAQTRFGPVQVRISFADGRLTDVVAVQVPSDHFRSQQIAAYAVPILRAEALRAQSAHIDAVSGATYTSEGYALSLQSALDQAHI